uniref:Growth arrest and DNA damage-inducible protein GADD45 alpha n=1 Tax=Melopsittacus undulatus TaxID=13146 RepID=A0A8V5G141_MELUD
MAGADWLDAGRITPAGRLCAAEAVARRAADRALLGAVPVPGTARSGTMTLEELPGDHRTAGRMEQAGDALEEVLSKALSQRSLTLGVYEAAKLLNVDPDNVVLCLLAADEEEEGDAALQIHFTLIQAFCCENDINILRVNNPARLAQLLLPAAGPGPPADLHCVLVTNPHASQWKDPALSQLMCFCRESRLEWSYALCGTAKRHGGAWKERDEKRLRGWRSEPRGCCTARFLMENARQPPPILSATYSFWIKYLKEQKKTLRLIKAFYNPF